MILKYFQNDEKIDELMEEINMKQINNEIKIIAREEYADEFEKFEKEKREMKREIIKLKNGIKEVTERKNLDPESKKILNSLIIS